ncbi:hypothetical protein [Amycolatopsis sp. FDAARGOS 1241]|nr:hypothetical protein [Amycolatopsis sp. FDAARGOS 1241]
MFGLIGLMAAHTYRRYRRGLRRHLAARWAAVTPERATAPKP